jgi:hypothetical protein
MHNITINVDNEDVDFARIACSERQIYKIDISAWLDSSTEPVLKPLILVCDWRGLIKESSS